MIFTPISPISSESSTGDAAVVFRSYESDLVEDQLEAMLDQERSYQVNYIPCTAGVNRGNNRPHEEWRRKICEWSYRVVDHFRIEREVVSISMNLFDRYLSLQKCNSGSCQCQACQRAVDSRTFQLAAMTSLYVAIKLHAESNCQELPKKKLRLSSVVELSRGQFTAEDICQMERDMLATLQWKVNPTTPSTIVTYLLRLMPPHEAVPSRCKTHYDLTLHVLNELARYLSELSVCLANMSTSYLPSEVAYASILVATELLTYTALPLSVRHDFRCAVENMLFESNNIDFLMDNLRASFAPEMLLSECADHPMGCAREMGLIDLDKFYSSRGMKMETIDRSDSVTSVMDMHHVQTVHVVTP